MWVQHSNLVCYVFFSMRITNSIFSSQNRVWVVNGGKNKEMEQMNLLIFETVRIFCALLNELCSVNVTHSLRSLTGTFTLSLIYIIGDVDSETTFYRNYT